MSELEWCFYCDCHTDCAKDKDDKWICTNCAWIETLKDAARKRLPSEKPGDGEVVLVRLKTGCNLVCKFTVVTKEYWVWDCGDWGYTDDDLDGWWPIKHLVEGQ